MSIFIKPKILISTNKMNNKKEFKALIKIIKSKGSI